MDKEEKKRLKKLGKALVEKRSAELLSQLAATNPAPFASDEYVRNEIAIREKEQAVRSSDAVHASADIRRDFIVRPVEFDLQEGYAGSHEHFWECRQCGDFVPTLTGQSLACSCGNICLDGLANVFRVRDEGNLRLVRFSGRVAESSVNKSQTGFFEYSGKTVLFYDPSHGNQLEYFNPNGRCYLWYPGNPIVVVGEWRVNEEYIGFRYGSNTNNPITGVQGGDWEQTLLKQWTADIVDAEHGDVCGLATRGIPYKLFRHPAFRSVHEARLGKANL